MFAYDITTCYWAKVRILHSSWNLKLVATEIEMLMYAGNLQCSLKSCMNRKGLTWNKKYSIVAFCRRLHQIMILPILNQKGWDYWQKEWKISNPLEIMHIIYSDKILKLQIWQESCIEEMQKLIIEQLLRLHSFF